MPSTAGQLEFTLTELAEFFDYLDALRESGATNMFGAAPYVREEFALERRDAEAVLKAWMRTFSRDETAEARAEKALLPGTDGDRDG